jgi:uncharacterized protein YkwD
VLSRSRAALATAVSIMVAGVSVNVVSAAAPRSVHATNAVTSMPALSAQVLAEVNAVRAEHGVARLRRSGALHVAATLHSYDMASHGFFSHESRNGASVLARLARYYGSTGYRRWQVGEALEWSSPSVGATGVVRAWLRSPEHRAILLDGAFREIGISAVQTTAAAGSFQGDAATIVTADFGFRAR